MLISVTETGCRWGILGCWRQPRELCTFRRPSAQVSNNLPVQVVAVRWRTGGVSDKNKQGLVHVPFLEGYMNLKNIGTSNKTGNVYQEHLDLPHIWGRICRTHEDKNHTPEDVAQRFLELLSYCTLC